MKTNATTKKTNSTSGYAHRWNLKTQKWERKKVGKGHKWETYDRLSTLSPEEQKSREWNDVTFVEMWIKTIEDKGSIADMAAFFCCDHSRIHGKKRSINKRYRSDLGLPEDSLHEVLPELPTYTKTQQERIISHFTPKPKKLTLAEKLQRMPREWRAVLNLKDPMVTQAELDLTNNAGNK